MESCDITKQIQQELDKYQKKFESDFFKSMVTCIENMFDHNYIFMHREFGEAVRKHPKGYVPFSFIFQQLPFLDILAGHELKPLTQSESAGMGIVLHKWIRQTSKKLWSNPGSVRRMSHYSHQEIIPVYVENIPKANNHFAFEMLLTSKCSVSKIEYNDEYSWAWVYTNDPKSLYELNGFSWNSLPLDNNYEDEAVPNLKVFTQEEIQRSEYKSSPVSDRRFQKVYFSKEHIKYPALSKLKIAQDHDQVEQDYSDD